MREIFFCLFFFASLAFAQGNAESKLLQVQERLDSLGEYAGSTVIGKDDSPVDGSGDFSIRLKHFDYVRASSMQGNEKMRTLVNSSLNALFVVSPASYLTVFSNLYLPFDFSGFFNNQQALRPNYENFGNTGERVLGFHPASDFYGVALNENMLAGLDMRGGDFGATLLMGGVIWTNQSPLSMWERETNQRFVSQYELYEEEKVVSTYYKEKTFKPVKEGGRAFWTNRSFGGMLLDVHTLPWNLSGQIMLSQPTNIDIGVRDGLRLNSKDGGEQELIGTYDYRGTAVGVRFAKGKIEFAEASLTLGANYMGVTFDPAQIYETGFRNNFYSTSDSSIKFENLHVATIDLKGNLTPKFFLAFDLALSWDDTTKLRSLDPSRTSPNYFNAKDYSSQTSAPAFGFYVKAQDKHWLPLTLELIYLPKDFYSPYSMSNPDRFPAWRQDEFYVGAGTFRYGPNMMGANLKLEPEFNRGRFDLQYGIHKQVEKGEDVINFKYNLVGRQLWETSFSWTRHKPFFQLDSAANGRYTARVAGRPYPIPFLKTSDQTGGLRSGYGETWDAFVPYQSAQDAFYCSQYYYYKATNSVSEAPCKIPTSVKWNSTITVDMGYDIGHWFNTNRNIMLSLYTALSGVSTSFTPVAYTDKYSNDMLMWSLFTQSEPAVAITPNLHGILVLGMEIFRAEKAYANLGGPSSKEIAFGPSRSSYNALYSDGIYYYQLSPINIMQTALGFGFDWDFAARAGLHFRYKYLTNNDDNLSQNNWKTHHVQAETKVWF
ncbi:MAG: hypothetical protein LBQ87_09445 [Candidatus Fibromonas sp.]|jgi:hypothetical protein|nr:hypothetical protein [Candidatus Fibromonas sp.]